MMPSSIGNIQARVARARGALLEPNADLTRVLLELGSAAEEMRGLGSDTLVAELEALRSELAGVGKLARNGEDFWQAWGRLSGLEPSYTPSGVLAAEPNTSRIVVQG